MTNETHKTTMNASPGSEAAGNGEWNRRRWRRHGSRGQSLVVAVMVLFLLLFLGGIFIALIANNIRATQRAGNVNSASYYAEAGVRYMDEQLMTSPDGADWRPVPDDPPGDANNDGNFIDINPNDPDYYWLQDPYDNNGQLKRDPRTGEMIGGYTRVNFGGPVPGKGTSGGRALVRLTYSPLRPEVRNGNIVMVRHPMGKYIRLESIGRVGRVERNDPTTWGNTQALGLRQEMVAYKSIGLTDYVRFITNKDNKAGAVSLGSPFPTYDRHLNAQGGPQTDPRDIDLNGDNLYEIIVRPIESRYEGPVRVNAPLTFHGINQFFLDPDRNDTIEVAGPILMNNVDPAAFDVNQFAATAANPNPGRAEVTARGQTSLVFPSLSPAFTTLNGLVRDSPSGGDPNRINITPGLFGGQEGEIGNQNLRSVSRLAPPVIDAEIGERGLTRYRALTRNAPPLSPEFTQANQIPQNIANAAGFFGWGSGMYINNIRDIQAESELAGAQSLRSEWLNPVAFNDQGVGGTRTNWKSEFLYEPPAVTIKLTPRYMVITQEPGQRSYLRDNTGQRITQSRIVRYTDFQAPDARVGPPVAGIPNGTLSFEGYPAERISNRLYRSEFVIYAEGNVRIRGVVGGVDPETQAAFLRHLTVVSGGTIYVDGNLLRDNITPAMAQNDANLANIKGKSSIALLAKDYVTVNTTQFMNMELTGDDTTQDSSQITLGRGEELNLGLTLGPVDANNTPPTVAPWYADGNVEQDPAVGPKLFVFLRHRAADVDGENALSHVNLFFNPASYAPASPPPSMLDFTYGLKGGETFYGGYAPNTFGLPGSSQRGVLPVTEEANYLSQAFEINPALIFPNLRTPYSNSLSSPLGLDNNIVLRHDESMGSNADLLVSRVGIAPLDIRIEAIMYAQEGSFFIIPGPWFNPNPNDTLENYYSNLYTHPEMHPRYGESSDVPGSANSPRRVNPRFPFYKQPMDIRITLYGAITENLPAEIGDQGAWLEKWGWVPRFYGSTGMPDSPSAGERVQGPAIPTVHGFPDPDPNGPFLFGTGEGIVYEFNNDAITPYLADNMTPIRPNPYRPTEPLPLAPRLPVAPGLLYFGERPIQ